MFLRVYRKDEQTEILVNSDMIWKIEVSYVIPKTRTGYKTTIKEGRENPHAVKVYKVFFGTDSINVVNEPPTAVSSFIEDIYNCALTGDSKPPDKGKPQPDKGKA